MDLTSVSRIKEYGLTAAIPHIKKLTGTPLWEIRILGQDNIRVLYASIQDDTVILLHGFIKKSRKAPTKDIETALTRYKDWTQRTKSAD